MSTFSTTFLGHQGWLFQSETACLLVDPLLHEKFGHAHALEYRVYPPRVLKPKSFPKIDAVVLTHEHDDHFDIPSLALLDRKIPIYLSARSSTAGRDILGAMGFQVHPIVPGIPIVIGDLELTPFCGDHAGVDCGDEWDTLPFLVRHLGGAGSFFSMVDITLTEAHLAWARAIVPQPGLVIWTNNALDWSHMAAYLVERLEGTQQCLVKMGMGHKMIAESWGTPSAMLMCAGGFAFEGERAWMNGRVFCVDTEMVCKTMLSVYPKERFFSTLPGQTFRMEKNYLAEVDFQAPFLSTAPTKTWPVRGMNARGEVPDYAPATGRKDLEDGDGARLDAGLTAFAGSLVGGALFKSLYSLLAIEGGNRRPTFAFVLRHGGGDARMVFEYVPSSCTFRLGDADAPEAAYLAGMECWATDLLAVLSGELGPIALNFGRARLWNALPARFNFELFSELYKFSHPLRRPAEFFRSYELLWKKSADVEPTIAGR